MKVSELTGAALDWAVAKCEGWEPGKYMMSPDIRKDVNGKVIGIMVPNNREYIWFKPSTDWAQGGPIIEREKIEVRLFANDGSIWFAHLGAQSFPLDAQVTGNTPLISAMRCYVAHKLGDDIEVPPELK